MSGEVARIGAQGQQAVAQLFADARERAGMPSQFLPHLGTSAVGGGSISSAIDSSRHRDLFDDIALDRPLEIMPTLFTNVAEAITGRHDERYGRAISQTIQAGLSFVQAGLLSAAQGTGVVATGSSVLGKILPVVGIATGITQIWKGWNELENHDGNPLALLGSRTARSGILQALASAMSFIPGVGPLLGTTALRLVAAANELDAFSFLDAPTRKVEEAGETIARRVHIFDRTPTNPHDGLRQGRIG